MSRKINQLKAGSILSYVQMALNVIIGLIYTPLMIKLLGKSEYGLYNTVASTISMLSILSLGFNSGYIRYYARYKKNNDNESISKLNGMFLSIFVVIGIIALLCGLYLSYHLEIIFAQGLTDAEYETARVLMILLTLNLAISFPMSVFSNIISAHERFVFLKSLGMMRTVFSPLITIPLLLMGYKSIAVVSTTVVVSLIVDICYLFFVLFVLKCRFVFGDFDKGLFFSLFKYTIFIAMNMIIDQINWNIDKILLGRFCGTAMVAVYAVGYSLYYYYSLFSTSISGVFTPRIHRIVNTCSDTKQLEIQLTDIFVRVGRIQFLVLALVASGVIFFGKPFILNIWAGEGYRDSYYIAILLIVPATIALTQNLGIEIQRAENKHQFRSIAYFFMALVNLGLSIYLCQIYGAIGSAIGTAISLIVANGLVMNIFYYKKCHINVITFWKNILSISKGLVLPITFGIVINFSFDLNRRPIFLFGILLYVIVYSFSMWLFGMNEYEKGLIKKVV